MNEETINAQRLVKNALRLHGEGDVTKIQITSNLLQKARTARMKHEAYKEEKKKLLEEKRQEELGKQKQIEEEEKKRAEAEKQKLQAQESEKLKKLEIELLATEKEQHNILKSSGKLLQEAESKLADAIKAGDIDAIGISLLEVARKRMDNTTNELYSIAEKRKRTADKSKHLPEPPAKVRNTATSSSSKGSEKRVSHTSKS